MALRTVPIHQSLTRPTLLLGCDRELIISSGVVAFALVISAQQWVAFWTGLTLWVFSLFVLQLMAKADPLMRFVYLRHIRYAAYYPARSTPFRENTRNYK